jgi:hypothetical protein
MKQATISLLRRIEKATGKHPAELEAEYGLGLRSEYDQKTGQTWRRLADPKRLEALHLDSYFRIASIAIGKGVVEFTDADLFGLGLIGLNLRDLRIVNGTGRHAYLDLRATLDAEQEAMRIFEQGIQRMTRGHAPVPAGTTGRGRPSIPSTALEARCAFERWRAVLAQLGADVVEHPDLGDHDAFLVAANELGPNAPLDEVGSLRAALLPEFDIAALAGGRPLPQNFVRAVKRLQLVFRRSGSNSTSFPAPKQCTEQPSDLPTLPIGEANPISEQQVTDFFGALQESLAAPPPLSVKRSEHSDYKL